MIIVKKHARILKEGCLHSAQFSVSIASNVSPFGTNTVICGVWGVTEQEMHLSPLPAIISTIFPRFNLNMAMPRICLATNII